MPNLYGKWTYLLTLHDDNVGSSYVKAKTTKIERIDARNFGFGYDLTVRTYVRPYVTSQENQCE